MYFPGTTERIAAVEGPEQAVFQVLDWILDKMSDQRQVSDSPPDEQHQQQQELSASVWAPRATCVRICVPRAVVGSLIGKNGGYIQSLRVATGAAINISPLFVTAEEACAERIVSVESRRKQSLKTAAFTLIRKINAHPEKASCRHVCYFRKHNFESPLAEPIGAHHTSDFRMVRQQPQQHPQQEIDALRRRTVSMVMGARTNLVGLREPGEEFRNICNSSRNSNSSHSAGDNQFTAFKRFCELRGAKPISSGSQTPEGSPQPSLSSKMQEVAELSRVAQAANVAAPTGEKPNKNPASPWECPSTVCSTAAASTDKLPRVTEDGKGNVRIMDDNATKQQEQQQNQQVQHNPIIALLAIIAFLLAALLRLLMQHS